MASPPPIGLRAGKRPLRVTDACDRCKAEVHGWVYVDARLAVVDTVGFMLVANEVLCDTCVGRQSDGTAPDQ